MSQLHISGNCTVSDEKSRILAWLSPLDPQRRHQEVRAHRVDEVGDWLLQTQEYQNWLGGISEGESNGSALFYYGDPGVGKTNISSLMIDTLSKQAVGGDAVVAYFYIDCATLEEQSPAAILGSVLKQIVGGLDEVPERIVEAFRDGAKVLGGRRLVLSEIVELLQDISASRCIYIFIDALDKCQAIHRVKLLDSLNQILQWSPRARIFLTGRPGVRDEVERHLPLMAGTRSITLTNDDIATFLRAKLRADKMPDAMDESLEEDIIKAIPEAVSEIFPLASLSIQTILQETTIDRRRLRLRAMKNDLDLGDAYEAALGRIKAQGEVKERLAMAVLMWIIHSRRPLQVYEIRHAIAIRIGSKDLGNDIPPISILLDYCQGLVTIEKGTSTVRLIHYTLREYLCTRPSLFDRAHSTMAEICLTYLTSQDLLGFQSHASPVPRDAPFLEYCSLYWGTHMKMQFSDPAEVLALRLLNQFDTHRSAKSLWNSISWEFTTGHVPNRKPFSALHCISYFGIVEVADILIKTNRWDMNQRDSAGMTPLIWAARCGHEEVVGLFLGEKGIQPDQQDADYGRTALSWAAENGHEGVVRLLLGPQFVNPGSIGRRWGKARQVVGQLFGRRYVNPNSSDIYGRTPLLWASKNGHEEVVRLLLGRRDVNPDIPDAEYEQTPLSWAAGNGREEVTKLLLGRKGVNPDNSSKSGRTALLWAAENGYEGIVELLLDRGDANPDIPDKEHGQTPLSRAAQHGREGVVTLLLGRRDVNPDTRDTKFGRTPLSWAAGNGHEGIVRLLLKQKDVDPDNSGESGRTPLSWAAGNGHEGIAKLLLAREDVAPDSSSKSGRTPLSWAAENGREGVVELLLQREDVAPDSSSKSGRTPLSWAAENGREGVAMSLLERKDVDPDTPDTVYGQTPLSWAAGKGHEGIVMLLLGRIDVNPDTPDTVYGQTPLSWAARNGREGVVKLLLERDDVDPHSSGRSGQTPLTLAAEQGHDRVVELLCLRNS